MRYDNIQYYRAVYSLDAGTPVSIGTQCRPRLSRQGISISYKITSTPDNLDGVSPSVFRCTSTPMKTLN